MADVVKVVKSWQNQFRRADILLLAIFTILAVSGIVWQLNAMLKNTERQVEVYQAGQLIDTQALSPTLSYHKKYHFSQPIEGNNTLDISDNRTAIVDADCQDKACVRMGPIGLDGQQIVCLPHQLVVKIVAVDKKWDAIVK